MLSYQVLGQVAVARSGVDVRVGGAQQRRLLGAMLAEPDAVHSVDTLIEVAWPSGAAPTGADRSILTYVSRLRAALGAGSILRVGAGYRLELGQDSLDADRFLALVERAEAEVPDQALTLLDEAFALWHGPAYGDFATDWWALGPAGLLEGRRLDARELRARCLLALDRPGAIEELEALVRARPLQERPVRLLMESLSGVGRRADALAAYRRFREAVREETGLDPSSELDGLARSVASGETVAAPEGLRLRGYRLHELIGEGRQGRVYAATQPGTRRLVAVKVVRSEIAAAVGFADRFELEGQLLARLEHPHVLPLYDYWREPEQAFLVFRHLDGGTARQHLRADGPWPLADVDRFVEQIGPALAAAHTAGIAHHDVQLDNIMLDPAGNAYLTDFGIAVDDVAGASASIDVRGLANATRELLPPGHPATAMLDDVVDGAADLVMAEFLARWRTVVDSRSDTHLRTTVDAPNPYRGLRPFEEADRTSFHGRSRDLERLVEVVRTHRFVAVAGPSGVGKSSLVRAGLIPVLRASSRPVATMSPGSSPEESLHEALRAVTALTPGSPPEALTLATAPDRLALVVDQFEECFTAPGAGGAAFLMSLAKALDARPDLTVVVTLRADFLDETLRDPVIGSRCAAGLFPLAALGADELAEAIAAPAREAGVRVEETLVGVLVGETLAQPGSLPLLQFTLAELFDRRGTGALTRADLESLGGVAGSVAGRAEDTYSALSPAGKVAARELFSRLVSPGSRVGETRRRVLWSELPEAARETSESYVDTRLLVVDHDPATREPTLEIAHDALIRGWPRLATWVDDDRGWLVQARDLAAAARRWDAGGRTTGDLYRGARLALAGDGLAAGRAATSLEREFLAASHEEAERGLADARRIAIRQRRLLVAVSTVLVVAVVAAALAVSRQRRAVRSEAAAREATREALIEGLVGRANALRITQRDVSALLAVEAWRLADTPTTRSALLSTFTDSTGFLDEHHLLAGQLTMGVVMPDGRHAWVGDSQGRVHPYDLESGAVGSALESAKPYTGTHGDLNPSPDGRLMLVTQNAYADDGTPSTLARVVDLSTGQSAFPTVRLPLDLVQTAWAPDGRRVYVTSVDGRGIVLDPDTGRRAGRYAAPPGPAATEGEITGGVTVVGHRLLAGGPGSIVVRDLGTLAARRTISVPAGTTLHLYAVGDGSVVGVGYGGLARVDVDSGRLLWSVDNAGLQCDSAAVMTGVGEIVCGDPVGRLELRSLATGSLVRTLDAQNGNAGSLWPARDGTEVVSFGANEPVVSRWRLDGSGPITRVITTGSGYPVFTADPGRLAVAVVPHGQVDVARDDRRFRVVRARDGRTVERLTDLVSPGWSSDGTFYAARRLRVGRYDVVRRPPGTSDLHRIAGPFGYHPGVFLKPWLPGGTLQTYPGQIGATVRARAVIDGAVVGKGAASPTATGLDASADGSLIVVEDPTGIHVFDSRTGEELRSAAGGSWIGASMSPTGQMVTTSYSGEMQVWDVATLRPIRTLGGGRGYITHVDFSRNGSLIMAPGSDRRVSLFDAATGIRLGTPIEIADDEVSAASLSPDGNALAFGGGWDQPVKVMDLRPADWAAAACRLAGRELTAEEWQTNVGSLAAYHEVCPVTAAS